MIAIERFPAPPLFASGPMKRSVALASQHYRTPPAQRSQARFDFDSHLRPWSAELIKALMAASRGKCAYCETPLSQASPTINAFRPYAGVEEPSGDYLGDHYWTLAFAWDNYRASCHLCARYKSARFPVAGPRAPADAAGEALATERPLLIDPCSDEPDTHLAFEPDGHVVGRTDRGRATIEILALNRKELVAARAAELRRFEAAIAVDPAAASGLLDAAQPFAAIKRQQHARRTTPSALQAGERAAVKTARVAQKAFDEERGKVSTERKAGLENYRARARFIERVQIRNFLSIERLELNFAASESERAPCFAVLGDNAVGKSSVLKAIALALGGPSYAQRLGLLPRDLLRHGEDEGSVKVWISGFKEPALMEMRRRARRLGFGQAQSRSLVLGYGSSRLLPTARHRPLGGMSHAKIDNLFDPFLPLSDAQAWLQQAPPAVFEEAAFRIKQLLVLPDEAQIVRTGGRKPGVFVEFKPPPRSRTEPERQPLARLSDGYQSMLGFAADLMEIMFAQGYTSMSSAQGVVLIDELGNHLHPRWRMQIVGRLRAAFPNVQFVFSTHDPLCLRGLITGEVAVLQLDARRRVYALTDLPSITGLRVDQLLRSEHFGLGSTVDPEMQLDYERYLALKRMPTRDAAQAAELERLGQRLFDTRALAGSPQERAALEFMTEARQRGPTGPARNLSASGLNEEAKAALRALFERSSKARP